MKERERGGGEGGEEKRRKRERERERERETERERGRETERDRDIEGGGRRGEGRERGRGEDGRRGEGRRERERDRDRERQREGGGGGGEREKEKRGLTPLCVRLVADTTAVGPGQQWAQDSSGPRTAVGPGQQWAQDAVCRQRGGEREGGGGGGEAGFDPPVCEAGDGHGSSGPRTAVGPGRRVQTEGCGSRQTVMCGTATRHTANITHMKARCALLLLLVVVLLLLLLLGCFTSQQHASGSQGRICSDNCTYCHTEKEVSDQTFSLTQSQYTVTGPTSPSTDPITPGAWQGQFGSHWCDSTAKESRRKRDSNPGSSALEANALTTRPTRRSIPEIHKHVAGTLSNHPTNQLRWDGVRLVCGRYGDRSRVESYQ